jgi:hypothetical protein
MDTLTSLCGLLLLVSCDVIFCGSLASQFHTAMNPLWKYFETARETAIFCCESGKNFKLLMHDRLAHTLSDIGGSAYGLVLIGVFSGVFIVYWKVNTIAKKETAQQPHCPLDAASFLSRLFFNWASPLLKTGDTKGINEEDLWDLCEEV